MKGLLIVATVTVALLFSNFAFAGCSGNACKDAVLTKQNGCVVIINNGDRPFKFSHGVGHSPKVYPQSKETIFSLSSMMEGRPRCMKNVGNNWTAKYVR